MPFRRHGAVHVLGLHFLSVHGGLPLPGGGNMAVRSNRSIRSGSATVSALARWCRWCCMDRARCDAWDAAFAKFDTGRQVWELPPEEHDALLPVGLFEGMDKVTAHAEGDRVVRYWLDGSDLSPIAPRGLIIAKNWHTIGPTFGEHRADEALQNYITASPYDPDYWEALDLLAAWFLEQHRPLPTRLANLGTPASQRLSHCTAGTQRRPRTPIVCAGESEPRDRRCLRRARVSRHDREVSSLQRDS